jgi:hypothetical protein
LGFPGPAYGQAGPSLASHACSEPSKTPQPAPIPGELTTSDEEFWNSFIGAPSKKLPLTSGSQNAGLPGVLSS